MDTNFEKGAFSEDQLEQAIINVFKDEDFDYIDGRTIHRKYEDVLLVDDLVNYLNTRYEEYGLTEVEIKRIVNKIKLISSSPLYDANKLVYELLNSGFTLQRDDKNQLAKHIYYIDFEHPENNIFKFVNQYSVLGTSLRRPDLLIFINGIPVAIFEFKSAIKEDTTVFDAWKQITKRYTRDIPNLMKYCMLSVISDGANTKLGTIFTPYHFYYAWNKINDDERVQNGISSLLTMLKGAFSKDRLLAILRDFIYYPDNTDKEEVIVCRYPQFFAAEKMLQNIKKHLKPIGDGKGGTYFGATGCGKTYTMLFLSRMLMKQDNEIFKNPTIVIITDREDLDDQTAKIFENSKHYLNENEVVNISSREELAKLLRNKPSGGLYITTIQKFCDSIGLLSDRNNIICISDEAHRTQTNTNGKLVKTDEGLKTVYGFAKYLRDSFPNATYCGFTGTPIDESIAVFGDIVDSYTMRESSDDGITVKITYEPRLARAVLSDKQLLEIEEYYKQCAKEGSTEKQIQDSKKAMANIARIVGHPEVVNAMAKDIVNHYEKLCAEKPNVVQKAMIVCPSRQIAYDMLKAIVKLREDWGKPLRAENEAELTKDELDKLIALPKINIVATRDKDDDKELYEMCGTKEHRKELDEQFKNNKSNFKIAVVVDMWTTGFDVPSLAVMYIDKPLQQHTLIQTISRVNRVFEGKDKGLVVDYIGIKDNMLEALKRYGGPMESPIDEIENTKEIFRNVLDNIDKIMHNFDAKDYYEGEPLQRLNCLNRAVEYVQLCKEVETRFMGLALRLKKAYCICAPSGDLTDGEIAKAQFYFAIRAIIYKQSIGDGPDTETMNHYVEEMVRKAISCSGVESIIDDDKTVDLFSDAMLEQLKDIKLPITKYKALLKLLKRAIKEFKIKNKVKAVEFEKMMKYVVEKYNNRDNYIFTNEVIGDFMDNLSDELINILKKLQEEEMSFEKIGITFEEKVFYDILVKVRDEHKFEYSEDKCIDLAKKIKVLIDDKAQYADWHTRENIKSQLAIDLLELLYDNGYPPDWNAEIFEKIMEQTENYKQNE